MKTKTNRSVYIRWMIRRDMPEVLAIESASFPQPWGDDDFLRWLRQRNCIAMVAEIGDVIAGYVVYELHKRKLAIVKIAVTPALRRQDIGRQLVQKLVGKLCEQRRRSIEAWVCESNLAGHLFFKACGFLATAIEKQMFADGQDGYLFERYVE